jgi:hypothetical protein
MRIYLHNQSTVISDTAVQAMMPAFRKYLATVASHWGAWGGASLVFGAPPTADEWLINLLDISDQPGALGYHDFTPTGKPISKIFCKTDLDNGYSIPVTITHELSEMVADPYIARQEQTANTQAYATEVGDPVETDGLGAQITVTGYPPVLCSDFVYPSWFIPGAPGPYDWQNHCTAPLEVLAGGYAQYIDTGGWHQVNKDGIVKGAVAERSNRWRPRAARFS